MLRLQGKTIAVTGAAGRLGRHLVAALEAEGSNVAALVLNDAEARLIPPGDGVEVRSFVVDSTNEESVVAGFESIAEAFSNLDGLIHTVGGWGMTPLTETDLSTWNSYMSLNLNTTFLCFREAAKLMAAGSGGGLVAITAGQGADRGVGGQAAYSAAKAGVIRLVEAAADELSGSGIKTAAVAPSMILFEEGSTEAGVPVSGVVEACLAVFLESGIESGDTIRVYGSLS